MKKKKRVVVRAHADKGQFIDEPILVHYEVVNERPTPIWLVQESEYYEVEWLTPDATADLHVYLAEAPLPPGMGLYSFHVPPLRPLEPGERFAGEVQIVLPLKEAVLDEQSMVEEVEVPLPADIRIVLHVGYGVEPFQPLEEETRLLQHFLEWQQQSAAPPVKVKWHANQEQVTIG